MKRADPILSRAVAQVMQPRPAWCNCFVNAHRAQAEFLPGEGPAPGLTQQPLYCEGWVWLARMAAWHGWVELADGRVVDVGAPWRWLWRWARYEAVHWLSAADVMEHPSATLPIHPPPRHPDSGHDSRFRFAD